MEVEKLLTQRFKVIATFPDSEYKVGEIEDRDWAKYKNGEDESEGVLWRISDFPHLFKPLKWYEDQSLDNMVSVKYLEVIEYVGYWRVGDIVQVSDYKIEKGKFVSYIIGTDERYFPHKIKPATKEQYESFKQEKRRVK